MFGYIRPYKPDMKIREFSVYKAVYCGLCHSLGRRYGFLSRMILSYDATALCILGLSQKDGCAGFEKRRCPVKPFKKCDAAKSNDVLDYWADISVILGYFKVLDNLKDCGGRKKAANFIIYPAAKAMYKKACKLNPFASQEAGEYITAQTNIEKLSCVSIDEAAEPTALLMKKLLSRGSNDAGQTRVLERIGYFLGKWIYLADAADDFKDDITINSYNPFVSGQTAFQEKNNIKELAGSILNSCIYEITAALNLLNIRRYGEILGNIFYLGLPEVKRAVLDGCDKKQRKSRFPAIYKI